MPGLPAARKDDVKCSQATLLLAAVLASPAWGQGPSQMPQIPGLFRPVVGSGGVYEITRNTAKFNWAYAVVGKETAGGEEAYWLEARLEAGPRGQTIIKQLMVMSAGVPQLKRMIVQSGGRAPMEMPAELMADLTRRGLETSAGPEPSLGVKIGAETITVPAGTFLCDHYRRQSGRAPADIWISPKVAPYGLVKMTSSESTIVLLKVLHNETSRLGAEPQRR